MLLQRRIPTAQVAAAAAKLPKMQPVQGDWLTVDEAYTAQLAEKAQQIATRPHHVIAGTSTACKEMLEETLAVISKRTDFCVTGGQVTRPDGKTVAIDHSAPLLTLSQIIQEDICILEKQGDEHVLTAALLCFPAGWTLAEKIGRPLTRIHVPVAQYDAGIALRVQRLFDGVRVEVPMWRANMLRYDNPALYQPHSEADPRVPLSENPAYVRSERQTVLRLPQTDAVVFAIHTTMIRAQDFEEV